MQGNSGKLNNNSPVNDGDAAGHVWRGASGGDWKASFKGEPGERGFYPLDGSFGGPNFKVFARLMQTQPSNGRFGFVGADKNPDGAYPSTSVQNAQGRSASLFKVPRNNAEGHPTAADATNAKFVYVEIGPDGKPMTLDLDPG